MKLQRTQLYLSSATYRRLGRDAAERGVSLAASLRDLVEAHYLRGGGSPSMSFDRLIGCVDEALDADVATDGAPYRDGAMRSRLRQKLGRRKSHRPR